MTERRFLVVFSLLALALAVPVSAIGACGASDVCIDIVDSLWGQYEIETATVQIEWSTDSEDSSIDRYILKRYNCSEPGTCTTTVTTVFATGQCSATEPYTYTDHPPTPVSSWRYALEVWKTDGRRACTVDIETNEAP